MNTSTRTAEEILTDLRRKLTRWENNLTANLAHYREEKAWQSMDSARAQLSIVEDLFDEIGR